MARNFKLEDFFLRIFKGTVLVLMALALVVTFTLIGAAAFKFMERPHEPAPAKSAPQQDLAVDELKKALSKEAEPASTAASGPKDAQSSPPSSLKYLEDVTRLYRCSIDFARKVGAEIDENDSGAIAQRVENLRAQVERLASDRASRGERWVKSVVSFTCAALADEQIIAWRKEGKSNGVFLKVLNFHLTRWDAIEDERIRFEREERERVERERNEEAARIAVARTEAITMIAVGGGAFAVFMALALYLILAKIELNLRHIDDNFGGFRQERRAFGKA